MESVIILGARRYDFTDEQRRQVAGVTVSYLVAPDDETGSSDRRGVEPISINAPVDIWNSLTELPGAYKAEFKQRPGKGGKPALHLVAAELVQPLDMTPGFRMAAGTEG